MKKILMGSVAALAAAAVFSWFFHTSVFAQERSSVRPRTINVEEDAWYKLNRELLKSQEELAKAKTELQIARAETEKLKTTKAVTVSALGGKNKISEHRVQKNDSLWKIAIKYYNDPYKWRWIFKANLAQIDDPNLIYPEQILDIPRY
jgi:nucleoid-associated protein YgaU